MNQENELITVSLSTLLDTGMTEDVQKLLLTFECVKNRDVQDFLHNNTIESEKRLLSKTTLVIKGNEVVGYFTLLIKDFQFENGVSKGIKKRLTGNKEANSFITILIAQLGRSDRFKEIGGTVILDLALEACGAIRDLSSLRVVCVEHDDNEKLNNFYDKNEFKKLQTNTNEKIMRFVRI